VMIRRILTGCAQKVVAYEIDVAASTASLRVATTLEAFGVTLTMRRAPLALAILAASHAISNTWSPPGYREISMTTPDQLELRMTRPEVRLRHSVTAAEYDVLKAIVEGQSYRDVGALLNRSPRTVANQLRSVSAKIGVCGRLQYVNLAIRRCLSLDSMAGAAT
jgi:DNA-binding CsgD family transcriptional regulator